jgi:hypothetical protein
MTADVDLLEPSSIPPPAAVWLGELTSLQSAPACGLPLFKDTLAPSSGLRTRLSQLVHKLLALFCRTKKPRTHAFKNTAFPDGKKTVIMMQGLDAGALAAYDPSSQTLRHAGTDYTVLRGANEHISTAPVACVGSVPAGREVILLDPARSPLLESAYRDLTAQLLCARAKLSERDALHAVAQYVSRTVFDSASCTEGRVNEIVRHARQTTAAKDGSSVPVLPIDAFIRERAGVCRHLALVTAYFLDRLSKDSAMRLCFPRGQTYYVRDMVPGGGHAWTLFIPAHACSAWHVDALWGAVCDAADERNLPALRAAYGADAIDAEIDRFFKPARARQHA